MFKTVTTFNTKLCKLNYCTKKSKTNKVFSNTIFLPKTKFPLRLEAQKLIERDEIVTASKGFESLYGWQRSHLSEPEFVLHDGPPYANGELHMGHAINKILKDTILRYKMIKGNKVHYVPGWDCHGLPIELKAGTGSTTLEIREKARQFAKNTVDKQKETFKSWGIVGDWNNNYATYSASYVKLQFSIFHKLYKKNLIFRGVKPVYWSPSSRTALAEAELEYNEKHVSTSTYIKFKIKKKSFKENEEIYALVWTTTPWTLPSNQAICYSPNLKYALVKSSSDNTIYIIANDLVEKISTDLNKNFEILDTINGDALSKWTYIDSVFQQELPFLPGSHVTSSKGTGLVHTAPAHGPDDFTLALNNKMTITNLVDEKGCYTKEAGPNLQGKFVLNEGTEAVLKIIKDNLVHTEKYVHSYPYDWRTKKPVIIRATQQWFIDTDAIKNRVVESLEDVTFFPRSSAEIHKQNLINQVKKRPYWCISRQRKWGVPIPVFFNKSNNEVLIKEDLIRHFCHLVDKHGTDFWWTVPKQEMFPEHLKETIDPDQFVRGEDILDIWFDSGISWANALEGDKVADMYLEGSDQFTGWFQSSLITSVALRDKAPYKSIYVHGFAVDKNGMKMSKSLGNIIDPIEIVRGSKKQKPMGVDTLRWWVACHTNQDALNQVSNNVLQSSADEVQKIRSVLRFIIASLQDYKHSELDYDNLSLLDKYILNHLFNFHEQAEKAVNEYQFNRISASVINLLTNTISALYFTAIKDKLYCNALDDFSRQASQFVLFQIYEVITQAIAPIIPHLVEEMHVYFPLTSGQSYFTTPHGKPCPNWKNDKIDKVMDVVLNIKRDVNKEAGADTTSLILKIVFSSNTLNSLQELNTRSNLKTELEDILQVAEVIISEGDTCTEYTLDIGKSTQFVCPRCRRVQSNSESEVCGRCSEVIKSMNVQKIVAN